MIKARILLFLGIWIAILPYLGFPNSIKNILFLITGFCVIYVSFLVYNQSKEKINKKEAFENFSENGDLKNVEDILEEEIQKAESEALEEIKKLEE